MHFLDYKSPKTLFFAQKYLSKDNPETFFEEYINFKIVHYLTVSQQRNLTVNSLNYSKIFLFQTKHFILHC
jgi:hypothetical protein